jgi:DNA-binding transcriptional LysR family regulator
MIPSGIEFATLRSFCMVYRVGSLSRAAVALNRQPSALSMQMRKLEEILGFSLFHRTGRGISPTAEGDVFFGFASRILSLGDEAFSRLYSDRVDGVVHVGLPEEIALTTLPLAIGRFRCAHPEVNLNITVENTSVVEPLWREGKLDVMIATPSSVQDSALASWDVDLQWVRSADYLIQANRQLDLVVFSEPCSWRKRMCELLMKANLNHRIAFTSPSVAAVQSAVENGVGVALLTRECIRRSTMHPVPSSLGLPDIVTVQYGIYARDDRTLATEAVVEILMSTLLKPTSPENSWQVGGSGTEL